MPVYVLEYLLGMYCASNDDTVIEDGLKQVKKILSENYVRPDESEKIKSKIKELGHYNIIDKVTVKLNEKLDRPTRLNSPTWDFGMWRSPSIMLRNLKSSWQVGSGASSI